MKNFVFLSAAAAAAAAIADASPVSMEKRAGDTTSVDLASCSGSPALWGAGILYGISDGSSQLINYYKDLKIPYGSNGGAQEDASPGGYATSMSSYNTRFNSVIRAFNYIKANGGVHIIKTADLWGADETTGNNFPFPGDNGDWSKYDAFVQQVISDVRANGMANWWTTQIELWNEPDVNFGGRPQSQFNEMFVRGVKAFRAAFPRSSGPFLPLVGPSSAGLPYSNNGWWTSFMTYLRNNGGSSIQPDVWNWHIEGGGNNDPIPPAQNFPGFASSYGLNTGIGLQNNEYGLRSQQVPSWSNWFRARYERLKFAGLRGNWASGKQLNDLLTKMLIRNSDGSYSTTGDYQGARYYAHMADSPCSTTSGSSVDSYATAAANNATALVGSQGYTGTVNVQFNNVNSRFGSSNPLRGTLIKIPYNNGGIVNAWQTNKTFSVPVNNNIATVSWIADNASDGWAVRLTA